MEKIIQYLFNDLRFPKQSVWFKKALYLTIAVSCIYWLYNYQLYFGENTIVYRRPQVFSGLHDLAFLLYAHPSYSLYAIGLALIISLSCLFISRSNYLVEAVLWLLAINLQYAVYAGLTAGDYLLQQFLLYNIFIRYRVGDIDAAGRQLKTLTHNIAVIAVIFQVCLLYFLAGTAKLFDNEWIHGTALSQTGMIMHFDMHVPQFLVHSGFIAVVANYTVLFYQVLFPVLVWVRPVKKLFLLLGIFMHLYIALIIGLVSFGLIMLVAYIYFWPSEAHES